MIHPTVNLYTLLSIEDIRTLLQSHVDACLSGKLDSHLEHVVMLRAEIHRRFPDEKFHSDVFIQGEIVDSLFETMSTAFLAMLRDREELTGNSAVPPHVLKRMDEVRMKLLHALTYFDAWVETPTK